MFKKLIFKQIALVLFPIELIIRLTIVRKRAMPPCLFIIGAPRAGTTFISQLVFNSLDSKIYFSNLHNYLPTLPCIHSLISMFTTKKICEYQSSKGRIKGILSLSEGGNVWNTWFSRKDSFETDYTESLPPMQKLQLQKYFRRFRNLSSNRILINKNTKNSLRIKALIKIFPDAKFLVVKRNLEDNCKSLFKASEELPDKNSLNWARPSNYEELKTITDKKKLIEAQIQGINKDIDYGLTFLEVKSYEILHYEEYVNLEYELAKSKIKGVIKNLICTINDN